MKNSLRAKLNMYSAVISFCNQSPDLMTSIPALQTTFDTFKDTVSKIEALSNSGEIGIPGITLDKNQLRQGLAQVAGYIALKVFAYADEAGKNELKARINFTVSDLLKLKDKELPGVCMSIADNVTTNLPALAAYGITDVSLTQLSDALTAYNAYISRPRNATTEVSNNISKRNELFKTADTILKNRLDKIVTTLTVSDQQFQQLYFRNRIIIDAPTTPSQIKGVITETGKNEPLRGVTITVSGHGTTASTGEDGKYVIKPLTPGTYSIEVSKKGYAPLTITGLDVKLGQITKTDITLSPAA